VWCGKFPSPLHEWATCLAVVHIRLDDELQPMAINGTLHAFLVVGFRFLNLKFFPIKKESAESLLLTTITVPHFFVLIYYFVPMQVFRYDYGGIDLLLHK